MGGRSARPVLESHRLWERGVFSPCLQAVDRSPGDFLSISLQQTVVTVTFTYGNGSFLQKEKKFKKKKKTANLMLFYAESESQNFHGYPNFQFRRMKVLVRCEG